MHRLQGGRCEAAGPGESGRIKSARGEAVVGIEDDWTVPQGWGVRWGGVVCVCVCVCTCVCVCVCVCSLPCCTAVLHAYILFSTLFICRFIQWYI